VITVVSSPGRRSEFGRPLVGVPALGNAVSQSAHLVGRVSQERPCGLRAQVAGPCRCSSHRLRDRFGCGARLRSSLWMAERTRAWTLDSSSRATCWSFRFIDFGTRMARKTTSSSMVCFLAADTAMSSLFLGGRNVRSRGRPYDGRARVLPLDLSVIVRDHVIKRSRSPRSYLLPAISARREVQA